MDKETREQLDKMFAEHSAAIKAIVSAESEKNSAAAAEAREKASKIEADISSKLKELQEFQSETNSRLLAMEQNGLPGKPEGRGQVRSVGQIFLESDNVKRAIASGNTETGKVAVGSFFGPDYRSDILNAPGPVQPLVPANTVPGIIQPGVRRFYVRDLMPVMQTEANNIRFAREVVATDAAAPQYQASPEQFEGVPKAKSDLEFEHVDAPVQTIATWIAASVQALEDAQQLRSYVDIRLRQFLMREEEDQILLGDGTGANLEGLVTQAEAYDTNLDVVGDTKIDKLRHAIFQVVDASEFVATGIVINHADWHEIELTKDAEERYIFANPQRAAMPMLWGLPVVATSAFAPGEFLVGAFDLAAAIWDRGRATVEATRFHEDFFTRNLVAILAEERIALTVYRPTALVTGSF